MNKSIYKKQLAFKNSLPQYKDGGNIFQKAGAGALGVLSKVPIIQSFAPMMENAKIVENNQASFNTGQGIGAVGMAVGKGLTGDIGGAVSSGLDAGKEFMEVGSTVAEQKGNTERADKLDKAAMGFQAGSQAAGMASMMGGNFKSGEGISKMLGFGTMFGNTGGNTPVVMKNGGSIPKYPDGGSIHIDPAKRGTFKAQATRMGMGVQEAASKILNAPEGTYSPEMRKKANFAANSASWNKKEFGGYVEEFKDGGMIKRADGSYSKRGLWDNIRANKGSGKEPTKEMLEQERKIKAKMRNGGYTYSTEADKQGSNYNVKNSSNTSQFVEPKKKVLSEVEKKLMQQQVVQEDGTVTDGLGNIIRTPEQKSTGALEESISPLDLIGGVKGITALTQGALKYTKAIKPKYVGNINIGSHPKSIARAKREMNKGLINIVLPNTFEDGGPMDKSNKKDLIKYNGATHENSPIGGIPIAENGQQLHSGFKSQIPANTKAFAEHGEAYSKDKEYIFSHNPEFKDMNGKTPADKIKAASQIIKGRENDSIAQNSYKRMEARIIEENENMRMKKEIKSNPLMMAKNGGNLPKYNDGAYFNPYGLGSGTVNTFGTTPTESMNTMTPSVMLGNTTIPSIKDRSNKNFTNTNTETINSSLFPTKNRFAPATMQSPTLTGNKTNSNLLPVSNPVIPTNTGAQKRIGSTFGFDGTDTSTDVNTKTGALTLGDKSQLAGIIPSTAYNFVQALRPAERFSPLTSKYFGAGLADMDQKARFNPNEILMNRNAMANVIQQGSTSNSARLANLQSTFRGTNRQLAEQAEKENLANIGIKQALGQAKIGVGAQDLASQQTARMQNIAARQAKQGFGAAAAEGLGAGLTQFGLAKNQNLTNRISFDVLKNIAPNFTLTDYNQLLKSGMTNGEIIQYVNSLKSK